MKTITPPNQIRNALDLGLQLAKAEFKLRNEGSYLGILWYLLNPILTFGILYLIFSDRLGSSIAAYPAYLLLGIIMFNVFQSTTVEATKSILKEYHYLIKSIQFPRESLVIAIVLKNVFSHIFEIVLFALLILYMHISLLGLIGYLPILIAFIGFIYGSSLFIAALTVYFVDLDNIWNFAVRIIWFGTPIFYAIENQTRLFAASQANPMYYFITAARDIVVYGTMPSSTIMFGSLAFSIGFVALGTITFRNLKHKFAELI